MSSPVLIAVAEHPVSASDYLTYFIRSVTATILNTVTSAGIMNAMGRAHCEVYICNLWTLYTGALTMTITDAVKPILAGSVSPWGSMRMNPVSLLLLFSFVSSCCETLGCIHTLETL